MQLHFHKYKSGYSFLFEELPLLYNNNCAFYAPINSFEYNVLINTYKLITKKRRQQS